MLFQTKRKARHRADGGPWYGQKRSGSLSQNTDAVDVRLDFREDALEAHPAQTAGGQDHHLVALLS